VLRRNWWSASFSALTRDLEAAATAPASERDDLLADAQLDSAEGDGLPPEAAIPTDLFAPDMRFNAFPAGSHYGTLVHDLLQWQAEHGWPGGVSGLNTDPDAWATQLARAGQRLGLDADQQQMLASWLAQIMMTNMPLSLMDKAQPAINLRALGAGNYWAEMGFTLPVQRLDSAWLDQKISKTVWPELTRAALQPRRLEGLLTGFMDLVLQVQGRYYVLDYKSNRLPDYAPAALKTAMLAHRYDVQAVLYVLALHRLLASRLPDYDFDQHMGGALYWFVRGVDQPGTGLLELCPTRVLIEALDAALSGPMPSGAGA
jgi:exodeoxyribonuclease V beta subunit